MTETHFHKRRHAQVRRAQRHVMASLSLLLPFMSIAAGPSAGTLLQQVQPAGAAPLQANPPNLSIRQDGTVPMSGGESFVISDIDIRGNTLVESAPLQELVSSAVGKPADLAGLDELASRITRYYQERGYPLSRAVVPAQTIENGRVILLMIEARYDKIKLDNRSRIADAVLQTTLSQLQPGQFVAQESLDRALLLLSDLPGITLDASLRPGDKPATSDLTVIVDPAPALTSYAILDGFGSRYTGRTRLGAGASLANPLRAGDSWSFAAMGSGSGLSYGRVAYELPLSGQGTRFAAAYSGLTYQLGEALSPLLGHGSAQVTSVWLRHPFWRSARGSLIGQLQWETLNLKDRMDASGLRSDRHVSSLAASLQGDLQSLWPGASLDSWSIALSSGQTRFDDAAALSSDAGSAHTAGAWSKWNAGVAFLQVLTASTAIHISMSLQAARNNLDPSQKMTAGGPTSVRAYDVGTLSGDSGSLVIAEWRRRIGTLASGEWQLMAFVDNARLRINRFPWTTASNEASLSGIGIGFGWTGFQRWAVNAQLARRMGPIPNQTSGSAASRLWVSASKSF